MKYILDTNIIIRFLANDHKVHSPLAKRLFEKAVAGTGTLILDPLIVAECVYVLSGKMYGLHRQQTADFLTKIVEFSGIECPDKQSILFALNHYGKENVDYQDAYLAAKSELQSNPIVTFNSKDFEKMGVNHINPLTR